VSPDPGAGLERRLLILAPVGKDAALLQSMLSTDSVSSLVCADLAAVLSEAARGVAAVLIAEESLPYSDARLAALVAAQPPWSDLPLLVLTRQGADSTAAVRAVGTLGNVTLLERPVRKAALASAVRSALRARDRQYQTRAHLLEREQADRRKDEFLATLAHELRNPLAPIRNAVQVMRMSAQPRSTNNLLEMMDRQVAHMVRLVDDLMEVSRITRGNIELRREPVELAAVIASAVETSRPLIEMAGHDLAMSVPVQPLVIDADATRLGQVFSNLLNNAAKYTDPGGRIGISARRDDGHAVVTVSDTGKGIAPEALPRVFDMFVQANSGDSRAQSGLGIGLTLVRSLVEMHGGSVDAHSAGPGRGSKFVVRLPLSAASPVHAEASALPEQALPGMPRVLVVDDNRDAADSLGALLQVFGADVRVVYDGPAALSIFGEFHPAAVFLDIGMPGMDGYAVAARLRERAGADAVVLVALTGWGQEQDRRRTQAVGFDHHLVKPADMGALQALMDGLVKSRP
jgi:signal transduction histidine kinase/CheY-like chemotaxis protein